MDIILRKEKIIAFSMLAILLIALLIIKFTNISSMTADEVSMLVYSFIVLLIIFNVIHEIILYNRVKHICGEALYEPKLTAHIVKFIILVIVHLMYWLMFINGERSFIGIIVLTQYSLRLDYISSMIYATDDSIIYRGKRYFYCDISDVKKHGTTGISIFYKNKEYDLLENRNNVLFKRVLENIK